MSKRKEAYSMSSIPPVSPQPDNIPGGLTPTVSDISPLFNNITNMVQYIENPSDRNQFNLGLMNQWVTGGLQTLETFVKVANPSNLNAILSSINELQTDFKSYNTLVNQEQTIPQTLIDSIESHTKTLSSEGGSVKWNLSRDQFKEAIVKVYTNINADLTNFHFDQLYAKSAAQEIAGQFMAVVQFPMFKDNIDIDAISNTFTDFTNRTPNSSWIEPSTDPSYPTADITSLENYFQEKIQEYSQ